MSANNESYNGWTNYETWAVNVHIGDTLDVWAMEYAESFYEGDTVYDLSQHLKNMFDECILETANIDGLLRDLLRVDKVNWRELAEHCEEAIEYVNAQTDTHDAE